MKIQRTVHHARAFFIFVLGGASAWGSASAGPWVQEPIRVRDNAQFRACAVSEGTLVRFGGMGRSFPGSEGLRWSPDSSRLLVLEEYVRHALLDARTGEELRSLVGTVDVMLGSRATWTGRGTILLDGYGEDTTYRELPGGDWATDAALGKLGGLELLTASANGRWAVMESPSERRILSLDSMEFTGLLPGERGDMVPQGHTVLSPDGSLAAWTALDGELPCVEVVRLENGIAPGQGTIQRLEFDSATLEALDGEGVGFSEAQLTVIGGGAIVVCTFGARIVVFDVESGVQTAARDLGEAWIYYAGSARERLVCLDSDGTLMTVDPVDLEPRSSLAGFGDCLDMAVSPDGRAVAVLGWHGQLQFVSVAEDGALALQSERPEDALAPGVSAVYLGGASDQALIGTVDGRVLRLDITSGQASLVPCREYELTGEVEEFVEWPVGVRVAFQSDGTRYVDKRKRGEPDRVDISSIGLGGLETAVSMDGTALISATLEGSIGFTRGAADSRSIVGPEFPQSAALSPSGRTAAIVGLSDLWIFDTADMTLLYRGGADGIPGQGREDAEVDSLAGFLDETYLAVQYGDGHVRIVDIGGEVVSVLDEPEEYSFLMGSVHPLLSRDGRWLLCAGSDVGLRIFDMDSESLIAIVAGHFWAEDVEDWCLSGDGKSLLVARAGGSVDLWDFPALLDLAARISEGVAIPTGTSTEVPAEIAKHSLAAAEYLRLNGDLDGAVAAYIRAEVAAPLGQDAMGARAMGRRILAGIHRCGVPAVAWSAVRVARADHRLEVTWRRRRADRDLVDGASIMAHLMDPMRDPMFGARGMGSARSGVPGGASGLRDLFEGLRGPTYSRTVSMMGSPERALEAWRAASGSGGSSGLVRAHLSVLDRLSLEVAGEDRDALLAQLPEGGRAQEALGRAWMDLASALVESGLPHAARAARGQAGVWSSAVAAMPDGNDVGAAPRALDRTVPAAGPGAGRLNEELSFGVADAKRAHRALEWSASGEWLLVEHGGQAIESTMNIAYGSVGSHHLTRGLKAGPWTLSVRGRCSGGAQLGATLGGGAILILCELTGPIVNVRITQPETGHVLLSETRLLAGAYWEPFDLVIALNDQRTELTVQVGASAPMATTTSADGVNGAASLVFAGLGGGRELALQGFRVE